MNGKESFCTQGSLFGFDGNEFGIISFEDVYSLETSLATAGLRYRADSSIGANNSLKAGLEAGATMNFTVNISTCRATSHDFLDIGTGGYNTTNYPDRIYGKPVTTPVSDEESIDSTGNNSNDLAITDIGGNFLNDGSMATYILNPFTDIDDSIADGYLWVPEVTIMSSQG